MFIVWPAGERRLEVWSMRQETIVSVAWFAALREAPEGREQRNWASQHGSLRSRLV
jgi:hypothetical protein